MIEVMLNSIWVMAKKPIVRTMSVQRRHNGADGELPLETEPQVSQDGDEGQENTERARLNEFAGHARSHDLHAPEVVVGEGFADRETTAC